MGGSGLAVPADDLVARLRSGDDNAFQQVLDAYHDNMIGLARLYVRRRETAEEVVQDTWIAVIEGIGGFEGRASLKAWIYAILVNKAKSRAMRDGRTVLFSELGPEDADEPAVDPARFRSSDDHWSDPPLAWEELTPERHAAGRELLTHMQSALEKLPEAQRAVILLRDVEGCDADEACNVLGISETNQRVLLHRGRARLRNEMERLLAPVVRQRSASHASHA